MLCLLNSFGQKISHCFIAALHGGTFAEEEACSRESQRVIICLHVLGAGQQTVGQVGPILLPSLDTSVEWFDWTFAKKFRTYFIIFDIVKGVWDGLRFGD